MVRLRSDSGGRAAGNDAPAADSTEGDAAGGGAAAVDGAAASAKSTVAGSGATDATAAMPAAVPASGAGRVPAEEADTGDTTSFMTNALMDQETGRAAGAAWQYYVTGSRCSPPQSSRSYIPPTAVMRPGENRMAAPALRRALYDRQFVTPTPSAAPGPVRWIGKPRPRLYTPATTLMQPPAPPPDPTP